MEGLMLMLGKEDKDKVAGGLIPVPSIVSLIISIREEEGESMQKQPNCDGSPIRA